MTIDGIAEKVKNYGYHCDGSSIVGYYVVTENYKMFYNLEGIFVRKEDLRPVLLG